MEIENLKLQKQIDELIDKIYPIGSYYETSDDSFDPNTSWGGIWIEETDGSVLISQGKYYNGVLATVGATIGEDDIQLKENQLPTHSHKYDKLTGIIGHTLTVDEIPSHTHTLPQRYMMWDAGSEYEIMNGDNTWKGNMQYASKNSTYYTPGNTGGGKSHTHGMSYTETDTHRYGTEQTRLSVVQLSTVVCRWHRIK